MISCGKSKEEQLISDYAQTLGDAKMDLNFKMISLEKIKDITAKDSLSIFTEYFNVKKAEKIESLTETLESEKEQLEYHYKNLEDKKKNLASTKKSSDYYSIYVGWVEDEEKSIEDSKKSIKMWEDAITNYNGDCKGTFLEPVLISIKDYEKKGDEILVSKFRANYSMNNPLLNNTKQEITRIYYLDGGRTNVLNIESE